MASAMHTRPLPLAQRPSAPRVQPRAWRAGFSRLAVRAQAVESPAAPQAAEKREWQRAQAECVERSGLHKLRLPAPATPPARRAAGPHLSCPCHLLALQPLWTSCGRTR